MGLKLYVGNLDASVGEEDLKGLFAEYGEVASAVVIKDRYSGQSRGFAFVEMRTEEASQKARVALNGKEFKGRAIRVDEARERPGGDGGRGGRGGGGGYGGGGRGPRY